MPSDKEMLTLAAITYRGFNLVLPEALKRAHLRRLMDDCMAEFSAVKDKWKIVWGPADFSAVSPGLDNALMYVAQGIAEPAALAIAIRGTNPISLSDWVLGDFMVTHQVPWVYGDKAKIQNANISASSALGLGILQHLRWDDAVISAAGVAPAAGSAGPKADVAMTPPPATRPASLDGWIQAVQARMSSSTAASVLQRITSNFDNARTANFDPLSLLQELDRIEPADGTDLKGFLRDHVASYPKAEIYVTGHSKGGALSSTLALWLADTRGPQNDAEQWTSNPQTPVHAYSFAGPTAGNPEFAAHSNLVLPDCRRKWNRLDIVPHAFVANDLIKVSSQYGLDPIEKGILQNLIQTVVTAMGSLRYAQICGQGAAFSGALIPNLPFPLQLAHQHLDSYLVNLELINEMSAATLLAPVL